MAYVYINHGGNRPDVKVGSHEGTNPDNRRVEYNRRYNINHTHQTAIAVTDGYAEKIELLAHSHIERDYPGSRVTAGRELFFVTVEQAKSAINAAAAEVMLKPETVQHIKAQAARQERKDRDDERRVYHSSEGRKAWDKATKAWSDAHRLERSIDENEEMVSKANWRLLLGGLTFAFSASVISTYDTPHMAGGGLALLALIAGAYGVWAIGMGVSGKRIKASDTLENLKSAHKQAQEREEAARRRQEFHDKQEEKYL